jgi:O-antigen ligase
VTFSREAILALGFVVVGWSLAGRLSLRRFAVAAAFGAALFVAFNMRNSLLSEKIASSDNWSRLTSHSDSSAIQRASLAEKTLNAFEEAPLLGQGFGTTAFWGDLGAHNFYLNLLADHGIIGIFVIPALLLSIGRKSWDFYAFAAVFLVWCLFSHNVFDDAAGLIGLAIEAVESHSTDFEYDRTLTSLVLGRT